MKIGILAMLSRDQGGVYQYAHSLINSLIHSGQNQYTIITDEGFENLSEEGSHHKVVRIRKQTQDVAKQIKRAVTLTFPFMRGSFDAAPEYIAIKDKKLDLIISPLAMLTPIYLNIKYIVTIHDLQHKYHPQFFTFRQRCAREYVFNKIAGEASLVVCESSYVKQDVINFLNVPEERVWVIQSPPPLAMKPLHLDEEHLRAVKEQYNLPDRFLFYPAQFWDHKNHINLVRAVHLLNTEYGADIQLILVGSKKDKFEETFEKVKQLHLDEKIKWLGYVPDEVMPCIYRLSTALVMPTLFESVSLPIWEAFHLKVPVASSNVCALPEQLGDAGLLFDPCNIGDIAEKVYRIWTDKDLRMDLVEKGLERIKGMTPHAYATQWEMAIEEGNCQ